MKIYADELLQRINQKPKDENQHFQILSYIINTIEYCKDTLDGLETNAKSLFEN